MPRAVREGVRRWAFSAVGWLAAWAGLYLVVLLLLLLSTSVRARLSPGGALGITPLPDPLRDSNVRIVGKAEPYARLHVDVNGSLHSTERASGSGVFEINVELPPSTDQLRVSALSSDFQTVATEDISVNWGAGTFGIEPAFCIVSDSLGLIWIAASGTPNERIRIDIEASAGGSSPAARRFWRNASFDSFGVLDVLQVTDDALPAVVVLPDTANEAVVRATIPCRLVAEGDSFPLSREIVLRVERDMAELVAEDEARRADSVRPWVRSLALRLALMPVVRATVSLPAEHPYVEFLLRGWLSPDSFFAATSGGLSGVLSADDAEWQEDLLRRNGISLALKPTAKVWRQGDTAIVELSLALSSHIRSWQPVSEVSFVSGSGGMQASPLLTEQDRIELQTPVTDRWSYDHALPTRLDPDRAVWQGPMPSFSLLAAKREVPRPLARVFAIGPSSPEPKEEPDNQRDFLRSLDQVERRGFGRMSWSVVLAVVPALALAWLLLTRFPAAPENGRLVTFGMVGAALLASPLLASLAWWGSTRFLGGALLEILDSLLLDRTVHSSGIRWILITNPQNAFWVTLIGLIGSIPLLLDGLTDRFAGLHPPSRRLDRWRGALLGMRAAYVAGGAVALWALAPNLYGDPRQIGWLPKGLTQFAMTSLSQSELVILLATALLLAVGWRGLLFSVVFLVALFWTLKVGELGFDLAPVLAGTVALVMAGLAAVPLVARLLLTIAPVPWRRSGRYGVAFLLAAVALLVVHIPAKGTLLLGAGALTLGLLWPFLRLVGDTLPHGRFGDLLERRGLVILLALSAFGVGVGWPMVAPGQAFKPEHLSQLVMHWQKVVPSLLGVGLALVIWSRIRRTGHRILSSNELLAAGVLYAVFLVGSTTTWLAFLPIPLLLAVVFARFWLFVPQPTRDELNAADTDPSVDFRRLAQSFIASEVPRRRSEAAIRSLSKQLEQAAISPQEYEKRSAEYRDYWDVTDPEAASRRAFALGDRQFDDSVVAFLRIGLLLAVGPIFISLYQALPVSRVSYPFPVADFVTFLIVAILRWGLYAAFFGLVFANLRGATGLAKGLILFLAVGVPFAVNHFLGVPSLEELRPFLFWITQLFVFFGLLGLIAGDLRLLRLAGSSARDLRLVHRLPALYAFASTVTAALLPSVLAVVAGKVGEVVKFFMEMVVPGATAP